MPFPPTPSNPWDTTLPPDTQLASQGAVDFRALKLDIMQRLSLLSGTFANRPLPETVNAVWGGSGFGLLYFATDTLAVYQWTGAAWVGVMGSPTVGGTILSPTGAQVIAVWRAPFACTVVHLYGYIDGATGSVVNVQKNGVAIFSNLTLGVADVWQDGGAVTTVLAVGDTLQLQVVSVSGTPNYISWTVNLTRP